MDDAGSGKNKDQPKPTWTERSVPETVRPASPTTRLSLPDDADAMVPAADPVVQAAYGRTGVLPVRPLMARDGGATDALMIQKSARQTRVLAFQVEGIHWRAGFAPEIAQTTLGQYVQAKTPPQQEVLTGTGFILRPVENTLEPVLRDLVPGSLLKLGEDMFGKSREVGQCYLYYIPHAAGASVGMIAWYVAGQTGKTHVLYLQTDVKRADPRIVDEMHKTFRASLVARQQNGPTPRPFDFWGELQEASEQLEVTLRNSSFGRNSAGVRDMAGRTRERAEDRVYRGILRTGESLGRLAMFIFVGLPQRVAAVLIVSASRVAVGLIRGIDSLVAPKPPED